MSLELQKGLKERSRSLGRELLACCVRQYLPLKTKETVGPEGGSFTRARGKVRECSNPASGSSKVPRE